MRFWPRNWPADAILQFAAQAAREFAPRELCLNRKRKSARRALVISFQSKTTSRAARRDTTMTIDARARASARDRFQTAPRIASRALGVDNNSRRAIRE